MSDATCALTPLWPSWTLIRLGCKAHRHAWLRVQGLQVWIGGPDLHLQSQHLHGCRADRHAGAGLQGLQVRKGRCLAAGITGRHGAGAGSRQHRSGPVSLRRPCCTEQAPTCDASSSLALAEAAAGEAATCRNSPAYLLVPGSCSYRSNSVLPEEAAGEAAACKGLCLSQSGKAWHRRSDPALPGRSDTGSEERLAPA